MKELTNNVNVNNFFLRIWKVELLWLIRVLEGCPGLRSNIVLPNLSQFLATLNLQWPLNLLFNIIFLLIFNQCMKKSIFHNPPICLFKQIVH